MVDVPGFEPGGSPISILLRDSDSHSRLSGVCLDACSEHLAIMKLSPTLFHERDEGSERVCCAERIARIPTAFLDLEPMTDMDVCHTSYYPRIYP
jgi:hypothetical protein